MTPRRKLGRGRYGRRGSTVALWIEGDRIVAQWRPAGTGRRKKRSWPNTKANRAEAKAWAEEFASARTRVRPRELVSTRTLWRRYCEAEFPALRPNTQRLYGEAWRAWETFVDPDSIAEDLGPDTMAAFRGHLERAGRAISSIAKAVSVVKTVYGWGHRHRTLSRNEVRDYKLKIGKEQRRESPPEYTPDEFRAVLAALEGRAWRPYHAWALCGFQGAREHQVLHLRAEDVDLEAGTVTWEPLWDKNGRRRVQPIRPAARPHFQALLHRAANTPGGWLFPSPRAMNEDPTYSKQSFWWAIVRAEERAGVEHQRGRAAHGTRRMAFHDVLEAGGLVSDAMNAIGDSDLRVASRYLKPRNENLVKVYEEMDRDTAPKEHSGPVNRETAERDDVE